MLKQDLKQLLTPSAKSSCFPFNYVYYKQTDGLAMGSPLGPKLGKFF